MAKKAWIERNKRKLRTIERYREVRQQLKANHDYEGLTKLPRDVSPVRYANRCELTGRRHAYLRKFKCSRLVFRESALHGLIPGVTKASW